MSSFSEQDPIDPDDPELDYTPLRLRERLAKLGPSVSQGARSEPIRSPPILRPARPDPKAIYEPARQPRDLDRRVALSSVAARVAAIAGVVAVVALLFVIMKPAPRQSVAGSTPSDITGSTSTAPPQSSQGDVESKPAPRQSVAASTPSDITGSTSTAPPQSSQGDVESKPAPRQSVAASTPSDITGSTSTAPAQPSQGDVESKPALAEFKALLASPPSQPATHEQSQQLLQNFLQWRKKANTTETSQ
jgi:hypothetical protein